jgi:ABC-type glycerol-3-phosphate transport system permease component
MLGNSAFIALVTVVLTLLVSSMAAFVLAHLRFAGKRWLANYLALGLTFPFATAVLPVFIRVRSRTLRFVPGSHFAPDRFQSGLCHCFAAGIFCRIAQ